MIVAYKYMLLGEGLMFVFEELPADFLEAEAFALSVRVSDDALFVAVNDEVAFGITPTLISLLKEAKFVYLAESGAEEYSIRHHVTAENDLQVVQEIEEIILSKLVEGTGEGVD